MYKIQIWMECFIDGQGLNQKADSRLSRIGIFPCTIALVACRLSLHDSMIDVAARLLLTKASLAAACVYTHKARRCFQYKSFMGQAMYFRSRDCELEYTCHI